MPVYRYVIAMLAIVAGALFFAGCGLDPMEQLTEDMKSQDPMKRFEAVHALARLDDPRATDALIQALDSDDTKVYAPAKGAAQVAAAKAAAEAGETAATKAEATPATKAAEKGTEVAGEKTGTETPTSLAPPIPAGQKDLTIGDMAGVALVKKGRERTTKQKPDPLLDAISKVMGNLHTSEANRARAAWVLGEIGDRMAIPALKGALAAKTAAATDALLVRQAAQESLEKLGYDTAGRAYEIPKGDLENPDPRAPLPKPKKIELPKKPA
jgi:hypothetical protein